MGHGRVYIRSILYWFEPWAGFRTEPNGTAQKLGLEELSPCCVSVSVAVSGWRVSAAAPLAGVAIPPAAAALPAGRVSFLPAGPGVGGLFGQRCVVEMGAARACRALRGCALLG